MPSAVLGYFTVADPGPRNTNLAARAQQEVAKMFGCQSQDEEIHDPSMSAGDT